MDLYSVLANVVQDEKEEHALQNFKEEFKEKLDNEKDKQIFDLIKNVCSMSIDYKKIDSVFSPAFVFDGKRSYAIEDITDSDKNTLKGLEMSKLPLAIRARVADVLWIKYKDYIVASVAAKSYKELFEKTFDVEHWVHCVDMIRRSIVISAQIGKNQPLYQECCQCAYDYLVQVDGTDKLFFSMAIVEILLEQRYGNVDEYLRIVDKIIGNDVGNMHRLERAYGLKAQILNRKNDKAAVTQNWLDWARYLEIEAEKNVDIDFRGLFNAENYLKKAIYAYRNNGKPEEGERVHKRLVEIQKKLPKTMAPIRTKFDVFDTYKKVMDSLEGLSFEESVIRLTQFTRFYSQEELRKNIIDGQGTSPLISMFGINILNKNGQTVVNIPPLNWENPEENIEIFEKHMHHTALEFANIEGNTCLKWCLDRIRNKFEFGKSDLEFLIKDNPIIPDGRERVFASAIYMGLKGDVYEALHILAPQVENLFRNIASTAGGLTVTLENDGSSKEKVLSSIFDLPELKDCYDNDILFVFKGMLNEQTGANIRNNIAHGIMDAGAGSSGSSIYFLCATIKLLLYTSLKALELLKTSEKLRGCSLDEE